MKSNTTVVPQPSTTVKATERDFVMTNRINTAMNARVNNPKRRRVVTAIILFAIAVLGFFAISVDAQDIANPQRGIQHGQSYQIGDIETINTTNGNLILNIPLASLPKGRGQTGGGVSLVYNSKLYDTRVEELPDQSQQPSLQNVLYESYTSGWRYSANTYKLDVQGRYETFSPGACNNSKYAWAWKLVMWMPDASQKEFAPTGRDDYHSDGFYDVTPDGKMHHPCPTATSQWSTTGMVYYSTDGTYKKLVVDYVPNALIRGEGNPWTMYMSDGSKITGQLGQPTRHYDRNGNYVEGLTDQLGRDITIDLNVNEDEDHITVLGIGGEPIVTKVFWKEVEVDKEYETTGFTGDGPDRGGSSDQPLTTSLRVVDRIELPEQLGDREYSFHYNSEDSGTGFGQIDEITMPSGATIEYTYSELLNEDTKEILEQGVASKTISYLAEYDGGTSNVSETWTYGAGTFMSQVTSPDGSTLTSYYGDTSYQHNMRGVVYKTVSSNGSRTDKIWLHQSPPAGNANTVYINPQVDIEFTTIANSSGIPSLTKIVDKDYDLNGNVTQIKEYDWVAWSSVPKNGEGDPTGIPGGATLKVKTVSEYYNSPTGNNDNGYWDKDSNPARNVILSTEVQNGSSTPVARTEYFYDDEDDTANLISTKMWDSFKGGSSQSYSNPLTGTNSHTTSATYDGYGNVTHITDANNNDTVITYGNITCPSGTVTGLYPTLTEVAEGTSVERTTSSIYDCYTGLTTSATDEDNDVTTVMVYDDLGRPTIVKNAYGTVLESWVQTEYHDADRYVITKADLEAEGDGKKVAIQHFDQLGRVRLSRTLENAATEDPADEQDGIKVQTRYATTYSSPNGYNYSLTSNPYRAATSSAASTEPTMGWTRSKAHHLGRHSEVETFSGATLPAPWGSNTISTGMVQTDIDAERTLVTDQAGKQRISKTNALGQLKEVWEILAASETGSESVSFPNTSIAHGFKTTYSYDTLNNLTTVNHGSQTRTFTYSSLSRLLSAANPESGTISYEYDANGNLTEKTDARSVVTNYAYDELNRVTDRTYASPSPTPANYQASPNVEYTYSTTAPSVGKLVKVESSVSTTEYTGFDILGRVTAHKQTTDGGDPNGYTTGYTYSLSGALLEQTYPSGHVVKNVLDSSGDLSIVKTKKGTNYGYLNYAHHFTYNAAGAVTSMQLGNGRWENTIFNSRLQPTQIALGVTPGTTNLLKLDYSYGTTANNGNVQSQTITIPGVSLPFVQNYTYDSLNRLESADEKPSGWTQTNCDGDPTKCWKQTFKYDRHGNRNFNTTGTNTTTLPANFDPDIYNPTIDPDDNRFEAGQGYSYDSSGNTTADAEGRTFVYDAENKQVEVIESSVTIGEYFYDGDGKRVKKIAGSEETIFVYDAGGKLIGEYSTVVQTGSNAKTVYTTNDHLGSPRINTDGVGAVISRHDYHPFGEEIARTGYGSDTIRKQFTGYERDGETGLDFAEARMYASNLGRFSTPDPLYFTNSRLVDPQQINLFVYTRNNPIRFTDPDGLDIQINGDEWEWALKQLGDGLSFKITQRKKGGIVQIVDSNGKVLDNKKDAAALAKIKETLTREEAALFSAITDTEARGVLNAVMNDDNVDIGSIIKPGENGVDRPEAEMLAKSDGDGGMTTQSVVRHEALEAYGMASGLERRPAHDNNPVSGLFPDKPQYTPDAAGMVNSMTIVAANFDDVVNKNSRRYYAEKRLKPPMRSSVLEKNLANGIAPKGSIVSVTYK